MVPTPPSPSSRAFVVLAVFALVAVLAGSAASLLSWRSLPAQSGFPRALSGTITAPAVLADVDDDSDTDILIGRDADTLWLVAADGTILDWFDAGDDILTAPAVGDVDFDGATEVVLCAGDSVYCLAGDDFDVEWRCHAASARTGVAIADLHGGDGKLEVIVGTFKTRSPSLDYVTVLESDGSDTLWRRQLTGTSSSSRSS